MGDQAGGGPVYDAVADSAFCIRSEAKVPKTNLVSVAPREHPHTYTSTSFRTRAIMVVQTWVKAVSEEHLTRDVGH